MKLQGMRIVDWKNGIRTVNLKDILNVVHQGERLHWAMMGLDATAIKGQEDIVHGAVQQVNDAPDGLQISWEHLNMLSQKFYQVIDGVFMASQDPEMLHDYEYRIQMYDACDIVIIMFDSYYWTVFTKSERLFNKLAETFETYQYIEDNDPITGWRFIDPQAEDYIIPCPHQHEYTYHPSGQKDKGPPKPVDNWNYETNKMNAIAN